MKIEKFKRYQPEDSIPNVLYLRSEDGQDWYECQKLFSSDTLKAVYDDDFVIRSFGYDISALCPTGLSVAEVASYYVPKDISIDGSWQYSDGKIIKRVYTQQELRQQAEYQRRELLSQAANSIAPLQYAVDLDMATDREQAALTAWKKYCVLLNRVDCSTAPDIPWPEQPK
ncbi:tail fiber assembly protein [Xenorhabdus lircayensis]|uniref:Tail fiber assembly protein n=1 Tax=Xenorhabdus lircayensis TaxID=2763499 RepID=A0ABS0U709_9GAMM|nr:tail fiber assembly protein [Xenorhabdus lircayensis]MBI6548571.1 tail fiber assembly protein [Xenorhabdus lircayensis]